MVVMIINLNQDGIKGVSSNTKCTLGNTITSLLSVPRIILLYAS